MTNTSSPPRETGLGALAPAYAAVLCDVWGVLHNGVHSFEWAREALRRYRAAGGVVVLITNAPRPNHIVVEQITGLGVEADCYDDIVTSGDVTRGLLSGSGAGRVLHIGIERDRTLYEGLGLDLTGPEEAEIVCCTGLRDDEAESPEDYDGELSPLAARGLPMICANPDIVVERGSKLVWCAGALAERYRAFGGTTLVAGKPFGPIYETALARAAQIRGRPIDRAEVLAIGDGAPTDLKGAFGQELDVLFVTGGIHAANFGPAGDPDAAAVHRFLATEGLGARAFAPRLVW